MLRPSVSYVLLAILLLVLKPALAVAQETSTAGAIPEARIAALQTQLAQGMRGRSVVDVRRACKSVARQALALLEASPEAPNRYVLLAILFQSQKRLIALENTERTRALLFETCNRLLKAPDEYAELRLEADLLLSDKELSDGDATFEQRAQALEEVVARYRDTPGEIKSLMMAAGIAPKLKAFGLQRKLLGALSERFPADHRVIEFFRTEFLVSELDVLFAGTYPSADGRAWSFPVDRIGHTSLLVFWSGETPDIGQWLDRIKDLQTRFPGRFDVFSFNVDDLEDGGAAMLRKRGLDWHAMRVPGGRKSQVYRVYGGRDPLVMRVNPHGHTFLNFDLTRLRGANPSGDTVLTPPLPTIDQNLDHARYMAELQSLLVGDFLVGRGKGRAAGPVPNPASRVSDFASNLKAIQDCFLPPTFRYRLTTKEALANYRKAEDLCRHAIKRYPDAPDLRLVRHCRIIALLGLWKLTCELAHLEHAVQEARTCLAEAPTRKDRVVPEFCLGRAALRRDVSDSQNVLSAFIEATGGDAAPPSALAAAAILALDAGRRDLHTRYRGMVLGLRNDDPALWPVASFLRDPHHMYRLFKAHYYHPPSLKRRIERGRLRGNSIARGVPADTNGPLKAEFRTLDGGVLSLPKDTAGTLALLLFVEPPADPEADFPVVINGSVTEDAKGGKREFHGVMQRAFQVAEEQEEDIQLIAVFLSEDTERIKALINPRPWPCRVVMAPGGLRNPLVERLGIRSPDRVPNMALLHRDGAIAWTLSGIVHPQLRNEGGELYYAITRALKTNIGLCRAKDAETNEGQGTP